MKKLIYILLLLPFISKATNYYVATSGNDANTGLVGSPWKTLSKVSTFSYPAGTHTVYFNRGDMFYGTLVVNRANISFDAYGTGDKPVITGLSTVIGWVSLGSNLWEAPVTGVKDDVNLVLRNSIIQQVGRYPNADAANSGYLTYTASTSTSITGPALSTTTNWTGAEVVIRATRWELFHQLITSHVGGVVNFVSFGKAPRPNYGYFFQRDSRTLDKDGEWWYNTGASKLRVFSLVNPSSYNYQISTIDTLIYNIYSNVNFSNLSIQGSGKEALLLRGGGSFITIRNCDAYYNGRNGIRMASSNDVTVDSCNIRSTLGSAVTLLTPFSGVKNLSMTHCNVDSTAMLAGMEYCDNVSTSSCAVVVKGGDNIVVTDNRITNSGWSAIEWQGDYVSVRRNFINKFCFMRDDGGAIYTVMNGPYYLTPTRINRYVSSNIILNGIGANNGSDDPIGLSARGLYYDLSSRQINYDSNTVANCMGATHGNNNKDILFLDNVFYNNISTMSFQRFDSATLTTGVVSKRNILYPYRFIYRDLGLNFPSLSTKQARIASMGTLDSNYYYLRTGVDTSLHTVTTNVDRSNYQEVASNFAYITGTCLQEIHSIRVNPTNLSSELQYNASSSPITYTFTGFSKKDVYGNIYNNSVVIPAWSSKVLIDNGALVSNNPPVANAGVNQTVTLPVNFINLTGIGTDIDGTISSYSWNKLAGSPSGINYVTNTNPVLSVVNLVTGTYLFELTVTDNLGAQGKDTVQVICNPLPNIVPVANAGIDRTTTLPANIISITGSGTDTDGTIVNYSWAKISGPPGGTISSTILPTTVSIIGLQQGIYLYELTVTDNNGATGKDTMQITVYSGPLNIPPVANAGVDQTIQLPVNIVTVNGSGSTDADGTITGYAWIKLASPAGGTITNPINVSTTITALQQGVYQYQLSVTDDSGSVKRDTVKITVLAANVLPSVNAGLDAIITLPTNSFMLMATATDADGVISTISWNKLPGSPAGTNYVTNTNLSLPLNNLVQGIYQFEITVTDNNGGQAKDTVQVTVNPSPNISPVSNAGVDQTITLPLDSVILAGSGTDADGTIYSYQWTKNSGPLEYSISSPGSATTTITGLKQGIYIFNLRVTDNNGAIANDTVQITVNAAPTIPGSSSSIMIYFYKTK